MRLSDHIIAGCGTTTDIGGIFTKTAAAIRQAQRFELTDDVALAAYNLTKSKPTSLLKAMPLCRAPFRKIWLEWRGGLTSTMIRPENKRDREFAPDPVKQGVLIETDQTGQRGTMTFAWVHKEKPDRFGEELYTPVNVAPLGALFNWDEDGSAFDDAKSVLQQRYPSPQAAMSASAVIDIMLTFRYSKPLTDEGAKAWMERSAFHDWSRFASAAHERRALQTLNRHCLPFVPSHTLGFVGWCAERALQSNMMMESFLSEIIQLSWEPDIEGEPPFAETIIAMMNSRNAIEYRDVDLSALNKSRVKRRKQPFLPYQTTHLRLSQAQNRAFRAGLLTREQAGQHSVRGHFKIRKTGVYWWSPFERGDPSKPLHRAEYKVEQ